MASPATKAADAEQEVRALPKLTPLSDKDLRSLLLIRHFELAVLALFGANEIAGTTHTAMGQEPVPVALASLLEEPDVVLSNHRGHAHYLARYPDPAGLLAEIMGREGALCRGVGGSQHLHRPGYWSTGVQGETLPVAAGMALHARQWVPGSLVLVYIGDGSWGEGGVYEALNMASLWQLPLVVAVENNGIAQTTPSAAHLAGSIAKRAAAFDVAYQRVASVDANEIRQTVAGDLRAIRERPHPLIMELEVPRVGPHSKSDDTRSAGELAAVKARDWYIAYQEQYPDQFARLDVEQRDLIARVVEEVRAAPPASRSAEGMGSGYARS
jgi:acetoin:2,6-dichlorophenolindophenol oxidoreductase subunit alpha